MSANTTAEISAPARPPIVDYAVIALILRCICSVGAALALYGARGEVSQSLADANKDKNWSAETLRHNVDAALRANLITTLVMVVLVAIVIKFIRDGRSWARWLYLAFAVLITRDIFQVLGFFQYDHLLTRVLTGLVGLSSIAALALLFLPEASAYFRPVNGSAGLLGNMFRPRIPTAANRPGGQAEPRDAQPTALDAAVAPDAGVDAAGVDAAGVDSAGIDPAQAQAGRPPAPRGKSRQAGQPGRNGRR
jgi:hypothetical protein